MIPRPRNLGGSRASTRPNSYPKWQFVCLLMSVWVYPYMHVYIYLCVFEEVLNINLLWYVVLSNPIVVFNPFVWDRGDFSKLLLREWKKYSSHKERSQTHFQSITTTTNKLPPIRRTIVKRTKLTKWEKPKRR